MSKPAIHPHDGDTRDRFVIEYRPLNGSGPAIFREQRGVDVQAAALGEVENR